MTLERDQAELRAASQALLDLAERPQPAPRAALSAARWRVARALLRYLPIFDRTVHARLRLHADPKAQILTAQFKAEVDAIYARYEQHAQRWTPAEIDAAWPAYRAQVRQQAMMMRDRLDRELTQLGPYLETAPALPAIRAPGDRNWAGDGWKFRDLLGLDLAGAQPA